MRFLSFFLLVVGSCILLSCSKNDSGTDPGTVPHPQVLSMQDYYPIIDSSYYAVWDDGATVQYAGYTMRGGYKFNMLNYGGDAYDYYYGTDLMAGLGIDSVLVWYTPPIPHIPDQLMFDQGQVFTTGYVNAGFDVTMEINYVLRDTSTLITPAGRFSGVAHITQYTRQTHGRYYYLDTLDNWYAHYVGLIKQSIPSGRSHMLKRSFTRGTQFGDSVAVLPIAQKPISKSLHAGLVSNPFPLRRYDLIDVSLAKVQNFSRMNSERRRR